ncbi:hypothetical protein GCM10009828_097080 [Actinoplanes couchii]|uniref:Uncharacterized protein n=1 Tax=Actinoplanes couchii TaxID=403638 RepID=A0ABQ3XHI8_9ACTN|nr:hypothetical protein Aco03nite_063500 [Actinoplanes couchii]
MLRQPADISAPMDPQQSRQPPPTAPSRPNHKFPQITTHLNRQTSNRPTTPGGTTPGRTPHGRTTHGRTTHGSKTTRTERQARPGIHGQGQLVIKQLPNPTARRTNNAQATPFSGGGGGTFSGERGRASGEG